MDCVKCGEIIKRATGKFCSIKCQFMYQYDNYIEQWKRGEVSGNVGINTLAISGYVKRYLRDKYGDACCLCGWSVKHPITETVPLEIDHIDGNAENTTESNLQLVCANCHSLTTNFRGLNRGKGRTKRN